MPCYFNEATAQAILKGIGIDACIEYAMPCVVARMKMPDSNVRDRQDLESEYYLHLVLAIHRYDPARGVKLWSWINTYLIFARKTYNRRDLRYTSRLDQLEMSMFNEL